MIGKYQQCPPLGAAERADLKDDIDKRGVMVPVEYDMDGNIIDGHHRVEICKELGIKDFPVIRRSYPDEAAKRSQARKLNLLRRHLDAKTKRALIKAELEDNPDRSDRQVAAGLGVSQPTVGKIRRKLASVDKIYQQGESSNKSKGAKTRKGKDGKQYKATKPKRKKKADALEELPPMFDSPNMYAIVEFIHDLSSRLRILIGKCNREERVELFEMLTNTANEYKGIAGIK